MQCVRFADGGFVLHKVMLDATRYSVWCNDDGSIRDAERIDRRRRAYPVKRNGPAWRRLESVGRAWVNRE